MTTFNARLHSIRQNASRRASELKFKAALANVLVFPFVAIGWIVGKLWFLVKTIWFVMVEGFQVGNGGEL